ncbi:MAG: hypothetical protein COY19_04865, partial [Candidatus Marinimicrobia bacterium CG_4_10_14_0_2_um_filter_48_9]
KQKIAEELLLEISFIPKEIEKDYWMQKLSMELSVEISVLREEIKRLRALQKKESVNSHTKVVVEEKKDEFKNKKTRLDRLAEEVMVLIFKFPKTASLAFKNLDEKYFFNSEYKKLYELLRKEYNNASDFDLLKLQDYFVFKDVEIATNILSLEGKGSEEIYNFDKDSAEADLLSAIKEMKEDWKRQELQKLQM